ncbi:hypothetical protein TRVA0_002S04324 [Trichomonascus vanleenenianus]|uniref:type-X family DNA polymerase n=1 Tax=Trichomonascus vanleenenianus TaxID=2268995 RepID=UPI003ECACF25
MKHGHSQESFEEFYASQDHLLSFTDAGEAPLSLKASPPPAKKARTDKILASLVFFLAPGDHKSKVIRRKIEAWRSKGAEISTEMCDRVTHIIVTRKDWTFEGVVEYANKKLDDIAVVKEDWVIGSIEDRRLLNTADFTVPRQSAAEDIAKLVEAEAESQPEPKSQESQNQPMDRFQALFQVTSMADYTVNLLAEEDKVGGDKKLTSEMVEDTIYDFSSGEGKGLPNKKILAIFTAMEHQYSICGDIHRSNAYKRAIAAIKLYNKPITTREAAEKAKITKGLAERVVEIAETGHLRRWDLMRTAGGIDIMEMFMGIHGVGPATARKWVKERNFKTLNDVLAADKETKFLSSSQKIGILRYEDFNKRIPRDIVTKHGLVVKNALAEIDPEAQMVIMGSYRRKTNSCGDIDIAIIKEGENDSDVLCAIRNRLIEKLQLQGFIKARLTEASFLSMDQKWYGASEIKEESDLWRRIDFFLIPWNERGAAYLHYTGSGMLNRIMRLYARKVKGMRLSEKGLFRRPSEEEPTWIPTMADLIESEDEKKIFQILELPYRPPEDRNFG